MFSVGLSLHTSLEAAQSSASSVDTSKIVPTDMSEVDFQRLKSSS
jgi:hypothetical protein